MRLALWEARRAASLKNYDDAARYYLMLFNDLTTNERQRYFNEFMTVLEELGSPAGGNDITKQMMLLMQSRVLFPREGAVLNASAKFFFHIGRLLEAFDFAQEAVSQSKGQQHVNALVNLENIKSNIMDQWHWAMLNDSNRNAAFATAIQMAADQKRDGRVLDIGTGTGLLTAYALRCFDNDIYCCEIDLNMCDIAEKILNRSVIRKHSSDITMDDVGYNEIDVLVSETMDCGLLGEGIACTIYDVHSRLLSFEPIIIPKSATVYACIIESPSLMEEHVSVFCGHRFLSESVTASYSANGATGELEPYWSCCAAEIRGGYKVLSQKIEILTVNFDNDDELDKIVHNGITELRTAPIVCDGTAHCIMAWFRCELFPGAPVIQTSPETPTCWHQTIYPLPKPIALRRGSVCTLKVRAHRDQLLCALLDIIIPTDTNVDCKSIVSSSSSSLRTTEFNDNINDTSLETTNSLKKNSNDNKKSGSILPSKRIKQGNSDATTAINYALYSAVETAIVLPNNDFLMMNDKQLIDFFKCSLSKFESENSPKNGANFYVMDITNMGALTIALVEANPKMQFSCYNSDAQKLMYHFSSSVHSISAFPDDSDLPISDGFFAKSSPSISAQPVKKYFEDSMNLLNCSFVISSHADHRSLFYRWSRQMKTAATNTASFSGHSFTDGKRAINSFRLTNEKAQIIPSKISVKGQIINCPTIVQRTKPVPSAHQGVDLSAINDLAISLYYEIEVSTLKHEIFSDPFELLAIQFNAPMPTNRTELPEFLCLTEVLSETTITNDGIADGLLFWFVAEDGEQLYSFNSPTTSARCGIYLFSENRRVAKGDKLAFKSSTYHGNMAFEVV